MEKNPLIPEEMLEVVGKIKLLNDFIAYLNAMRAEGVTQIRPENNSQKIILNSSKYNPNFLDTLATVLKLITKKKGNKRLSVKGRAFLKDNICEQFLSLFMGYFHFLDWQYFFPASVGWDENIATKLWQEYRLFILDVLMSFERDAEDWVNVDAFVDYIRVTADLKISSRNQDRPDWVRKCIEAVILDPFSAFCLLEFRQDESTTRSFRLTPLGFEIVRGFISIKTMQYYQSGAFLEPN